MGPVPWTNSTEGGLRLGEELQGDRRMVGREMRREGHAASTGPALRLEGKGLSDICTNFRSGLFIGRVGGSGQHNNQKGIESVARCLYLGVCVVVAHFS